MHELENKVLSVVERHDMLDSGEKVLVAVSGGVDSMVLLLILRSLPLELKLHVFHLNHGLRPEAEEEARLVAGVCKNWALPCLVERVELPKSAKGGSVQSRARRVRYRLLAKAAREAGADKIALGHQANDQVETVLMRFLTGAGPEGLSGIPPVRGRYIRPLLEVGREEILAYAREKNLVWAEDASNRKTIYLRNRIRHRLIPYLLREYQPRLEERLQETAFVLREWTEFMADAVAKTLEEWQVDPGKECFAVPVERWLSLPVGLRRAVFRRLFFCAARAGARPEFKHSEAVLHLLAGENGKRIILPGEVECKKENNLLFIGPRQEKKKTAAFRYRLTIPGRTVLPGERGLVETAWVPRSAVPEDWQRISCREVFLDREKIVSLLYLRTRRPGDRFHPLGLDGSKKLKDFFIDGKIPRPQRDEILLLVDGKDRILWVAGRPDERARVTGRTREVLYLQFFPRKAGDVFYCGNNPSMV